MIETKIITSRIFCSSPFVFSRKFSEANSIAEVKQPALIFPTSKSNATFFGGCAPRGMSKWSSGYTVVSIISR